MSLRRHILINAVSMGSGGGFTVGREVIRNIAMARPDWKITASLISSHKLHEQMRQVSLPKNCELMWAPARSTNRADRSRWERRELAHWAEEHFVDAVIQLNGILVPTMRPPTLCHMQDPWPYRPEAWEGWKDRLVALMKCRAHRQTLKQAAAFTWTSDYLRKLICGYHNIWPAHSEVVYNGVPDEWIARAASMTSWNDRPNEIITVSNVSYYKRHYLVIQALAELIKRPGLGDTIYRIVGECHPPLQAQLEELARGLGVAEHVKFEGRVSDAEVARFYQQAKAFVMMSVCESFGIPAIEAMSFGTPVVTADCCAMPEVCGDAAELTPVDDVKTLAEKLAAVMKDPARAEQLRVLGAVRATKFRWPHIGQRMALMLERIMPEDAAPASAAPMSSTSA